MQRKIIGWNNVPFDFKTKKSWKYKFKNILENEYSTAEVEFQVGDNPLNLKTVPVYHRSQTIDFVPTRKELAFEEFWQIFCNEMDKNRHLKKKTKGAKGWCHRSSDHFKFANRLCREKLQTHLNQYRPIGVFPKSNIPLSKTRFVIIDLDLHNKDQSIFLQMLKVLLDVFWGKGKCFIGLNPLIVNGIHLIFVFDEPKNVIQVTNEIKDILKNLDIENEQLINDALSSGMNSFCAIEVFPRNDRGVRLPMGQGYTVITDHILANVPHTIKKRTRLVADFISLIDWLEDPNRKYMEKDAVINFIADKISSSSINIKVNNPKETSVKTTVPSELKTNSSTKGSSNSALKDPIKLKGNFYEILYNFWVKGDPVQEKDGNFLNKQVLYLTKIAKEFDYKKEEIVFGILRMLAELPPKSKAVSRRLIIDDPDTLKSDVSRIVENVFKKTASSEIKNTAEKFKKYKLFDPLNTKTLGFNKRQKINLIWTKADRKNFYKTLSPVLNVKNINTILKFIKEFVGLVESMDIQNRGFSRNYLRKYWVPKHFPSIKVGNNTKVQKIFEALIRLGIIKTGPAGKGNKQRGCTKWKIGEKARAAMV